MNEHVSMISRRVITLPGVRMRRYAPITGRMLPTAPGMRGTIIDFTSHGSAPYTRYHVVFDDGSRATDMHEGADFILASAPTARELADLAGQLVAAFRLSPRMVDILITSADSEERYPVVREAGRRTEGALIARGLACALRGTTERPAYRYTGVYGSTTTVYDAYLGARLDRVGAYVARVLRRAHLASHR